MFNKWTGHSQSKAPLRRPSRDMPDWRLGGRPSDLLGISTRGLDDPNDIDICGFHLCYSTSDKWGASIVEMVVVRADGRLSA